MRGFLCIIFAPVHVALTVKNLSGPGQQLFLQKAFGPAVSMFAPFPEVMWIQADMYHEDGVPINIAESLMGPRVEEVLRGVLPSNYNQAVDA